MVTEPRKDTSEQRGSGPTTPGRMSTGWDPSSGRRAKRERPQVTQGGPFATGGTVVLPAGTRWVEAPERHVVNLSEIAPAPLALCPAFIKARAMAKRAAVSHATSGGPR